MKFKKITTFYGVGESRLEASDLKISYYAEYILGRIA